MGTHIRVPSETYPINTNMTGIRKFSNIFVFWSRVASALEDLTLLTLEWTNGPT